MGSLEPHRRPGRSKVVRLAHLVGARPRSRADHWSFLFGEMAVYSLVVLLVSGAFLTFFYDPGMAQVIYQGGHTPLRGVLVSRAFASTLEVSLEVRGGLLMRQVHHWATLILIAAVCLHLLRLFFTGAFRRPHGLNWLIWVGLFVLGIVAGVTGGILPDDLLSGGSLALIQGVTQAIPFAGTYLTGLLFGGAVPGEQVIPLFYWLHVLLVPVIMIGLLIVRRGLLRRHGRTHYPGAAQLPPLSSPALFLATCGVLTLLGTVAQINPIWLYGPSRPGTTGAGAVPDWYMGFLDGAIRIMPSWEPIVAGHPLTLSVLIPALVVPGGFFTVLAAYPLIERRLTGDSGVRRPLDRPREAAVRTALGAAGMTFYGLLWAAAANDQFAYHFSSSLFAVTWFFRIAVVAGPAVVFEVTRRICLTLQAQGREQRAHGVETGIIRRSARGEYTEVHQAATALPAHGGIHADQH
ncbi:cytochrome b N-terminal domain-containing protein [Nonomuraea sp. NEAU-A123]|uniref:cytochrome bc1 complex cytochrome b subunit n=1 Tax=Nonomuraea sp. NEAU-A123 TaxID=2839649 RepID=UPI001BE4589B|nr:cytochrome b N-terminal domain-containing protein [Nonomuraea sp. NEAU-A123]MBT2232209.1 cytochrome b N-terminal domain-containing protein [Nonomuraea sp. NEAU-A123]